jgi:hypothetical protein
VSVPATSLPLGPAWVARALNSPPWIAAVVVLLVSSAFVAVRATTVGEGDLTTFIVHGEALSRPATAEAEDPVIRRFPGGGYDGQYYYRMALDPLDLSHDAHGIHLDTGARRQRIGYPALTYLFSAGRPQSIPIGMVAVNLLAVSLAALLAGLWSRSHGRAAAWGLLVVGYGGLVHALSRNLTEPVSFTFLLAAILLLQKEKPGWAVAFMSAAALTRETALVLPGALLLCAMLSRWRSSLRPTRHLTLWLVPVLIWGAWQAACRFLYGAFPVAEEASALVVPGSAASDAVWRWLSGPNEQQLQLLLAVTSVAWIVVSALLVARRTAPSYLLVATGTSALLVLSLSKAVWVDDAMQLRIFGDVHLYGSAALLTTQRRALPLMALTATMAVLALAVRLRLAHV